MDPDTLPPDPAPSTFNYVLSFLLVGVAWGFTTPFIRRAAADFNLRQEEKNGTANGGRGRSSSQLQRTQPAGFTDGPEEAELLDRSEDGVRRRSTSSTRDATMNTDGVVDDNEGGTNAGMDEDQPIPAWRSGEGKKSWVRRKIVSVFWTVINLLRTPAYAVPLVINLTGSIWFFLLVGKHELSLTVPLANSSAFLFTVLGEWYVERKVIAMQTWLGMGLVLGGIALCVHSKNQGV
ncbi:uncharacterized protein N7515_008349 [Penicillium bovifimosum]|uniref:Integral membrane protein n=1 Tax=Penicillium bovifimosum TaxID=126998 RepID=A0A9W9KWA5_9EURO|nr:uncharacterized protein N7515_008349 [Penicillium bovifimosum]KAJ5124524.1 hypothetical protein N7515_008349 [Penicillium bovifimosum]